MLFVPLYNSIFFYQPDEDIETEHQDQQVKTREDANLVLQEIEHFLEIHSSGLSYIDYFYITKKSTIVAIKKSETYVFIKGNGNIEFNDISLLGAYAEQDSESFIPFLDEKRVYTFVRFVANQKKKFNDFFKNSEIICTTALPVTTNGIVFTLKTHKIGELVVNQYTILFKNQDNLITSDILPKFILHLFNVMNKKKTDIYFAFDADMTCTDIIFFAIYLKFTNGYMNKETFNYNLEVIKIIFPNLNCMYELFEICMNDLELDQTIP